MLMQIKNFWCYRRILFSSGFFRTLFSSRQNAVADRQGAGPVAGPYMAEFDITYRCNCNCMMCQRWRDPRRDELQIPEYKRLAAELHEMGSHQISIAGGEPLMRKSVFDIIEAFSQRGMSVNLCTNGMLVERHLDRICESNIRCVTISVDGATAECHDALRGVSGGYRQVEAGIEALLRRPKRSRPIVRVRMTVSNRNLPELNAFYRRWAGVADDVLIQPVHSCDDAYYTGMETNTYRMSADNLAAQVKGTPLQKDPYMRRLLESLHRTGLYPDQPCYAGVLMARIDPWGNVYACLEQHRRVGSVRNQTFSSVWFSDAFKRERFRLKTNKNCRCWYNNTALIGHYGRLLSRTALPLWHSPKSAYGNSVAGLTGSFAPCRKSVPKSNASKYDKRR